MSTFLEVPDASDPVDISAGADTPPADKRVNAIFVGTGGDVVCRKVKDVTSRTYKAASGTYLYGQFVEIQPASGGTTASDMIWEYACGCGATGG